MLPKAKIFTKSNLLMHDYKLLALSDILVLFKYIILV